MFRHRFHAQVRHGWLRFCLPAVLFLLLPFAASAGYPDRPVVLIVPWSAGGPADTVARLFARDLARAIGQSVVIENKPGAGGNIGTALATRAAPDGYTLLLATSSTNAINPWLIKDRPFKPVDDLTPISLITSNSNILVVRSDSPYTSLDALLQDARKRPGVLNYSSGGVGSSQHVAGSMFTHQLGLDIVHVPYNGGGPAGNALLAGEVSLALDTGTIAFIKSGRLRALAVASKERLPMLPDVPTFAELGYPDMVTGAWYAIAAPAGLPSQVTDYLNRKIGEVMSDPQLVARLGEHGAVVVKPMASGKVRDFMQAELQKYKAVVTQLGSGIQ
ncbi:Tripartite tricarboxylate transporter family receptor [compost metagenome]